MSDVGSLANLLAWRFGTLEMSSDGVALADALSLEGVGQISVPPSLRDDLTAFRHLRHERRIRLASQWLRARAPGVRIENPNCIQSDAATSVLPEDAEARKNAPIFDGVLNYFPLAVAAVARTSKRGNDQHNPGQALHWARGKSMDHANCIVRHLIDHQTRDAETGEYRHAEAAAWRALALLQELEEKRLGKGLSRGSR